MRLRNMQAMIAATACVCSLAFTGAFTYHIVDVTNLDNYSTAQQYIPANQQAQEQAQQQVAGSDTGGYSPNITDTCIKQGKQWGEQEDNYGTKWIVGTFATKSACTTQAQIDNG